MTNSKKLPKAVQGASVGAVVANGKNLPAVILKPTKEELLQEEINNLRKQLNGIPKSFEEKTKYFAEKTELVEKHDSLVSQHEQLLELSKNVEEDMEENDFESEHFSISLFHKNGYRSDEALKINNPVMVKELLEFVINRLERRIDEYKALIEA